MKIKKIKTSIESIKNKEIDSSLIIEKVKKKKISGWPLVLGYLGIFLEIAGILCLLPCFTLIFYQEELIQIYAFLIPGGGAVLLGLPFCFVLKNRQTTTLGKFYDYVFLMVVWIITIIINAIPYMLPQKIGGLGLSFTKSIFESTSGLTTTGFSILGSTSNQIDPSSIISTHIFLFHRSLLGFFGGIGFTIILASAVSNRFGIRLYQSEGHNDKFLPNLAKSARLVFGMYIGLVIIFSILLYVSGVNEWSYPNITAKPTYFDALTLSMSSISSCGFTIRNYSAMFYDSIGVDIILMIMMLIASTNFFIIYSLITFKFKKVFNDAETKFTLAMMIIFIPLILLSFMYSPSSPVKVDDGYAATSYEFLPSLKYSFFYFFSASSGTGMDLISNIGTNLSSVTMFLFIILMGIGGGVGSSSAGIKRFRLAYACKGIYYSIKDTIKGDSHYIYPKTITRFGEDKPFDEDEYKSSITYILLYVFAILLFSIIISFITPEEYGFAASIFEVTSALSNVGLSSGIVSLNSIPILWILIILMLIGRLELMTIIFGSYRIGKDIFHREKKI